MNQDRFTERLAVGFLGLLSFATVAGGIVLAWNDKSLPGEIIAIGSAAAGVIGGMFSNLGRSNEPAPVNVVNERDDPIPVADVPHDGFTLVEVCLVVVVVILVLWAIGDVPR